MSLSFVSKAIQTTTEDGGFEETEIIGGASTSSAGLDGTGKPLFEQLRANQEQAEAEREEQQIATMRGTLALDEEDAAHLASLERLRKMEETKKRQQTQLELELFRAAQAERLERQQEEKHNPIETVKERIINNDIKLFGPPPSAAESSNKTEFAPIIKKKRRRMNDDATPASKKGDACTMQNPVVINSSAPTKDVNTETSKDRGNDQGDKNVLSTLLTGYGSSSDED
jgi:hypothetical protein